MLTGTPQSKSKLYEKPSAHRWKHS